MQRFFFHVRQGDLRFEDTQGALLPDIAAAWHWAVQDARLLAGQHVLDAALEEQWRRACGNHYVDRDGQGEAENPIRLPAKRSQGGPNHSRTRAQLPGLRPSSHIPSPLLDDITRESPADDLRAFSSSRSGNGFFRRGIPA